MSYLDNIGYSSINEESSAFPAPEFAELGLSKIEYLAATILNGLLTNADQNAENFDISYLALTALQGAKVICAAR